MNVFLVIAEDTSLCEALRATLPPSDLLLVESSPMQAERRLTALQADAILLDDVAKWGYEALATLKSLAPQTPVLLFTPHTDPLVHAQWLREGVAHVFSKPFHYESFHEVITRLKQPVSASAMTKTPPLPAVPQDPQGTQAQAAFMQHKMVLRWMNRAALLTHDPSRLAQSLAELLSDVFDTMRCAVILEVEGRLDIVAHIGMPKDLEKTLQFNYTTGLMRWFDEHACLLDRQALELSVDDYAALKAVLKQLQVMEARLAAPLLHGGRVYGALIIGEKASGVGYTADERELFTLLTRSASNTFERITMTSHAVAQKQQHLQILEHLHTGVVHMAADKTITFINAHAAQLLHLSPASLIGKSIQRLGSGFADVALRALLDNSPHRSTNVQDHATGLFLHVHAQPMQETGIVLTFNVAPEIPGGDAVGESPFWGYLASRVAQEIKNPMVAINTFAQLLPRKYDSEDFRESFSEVVQQEVDRINKVVETLFEFSSSPDLVMERCDVNATLQEVVQRFEEELAEHTIELDTDYDADITYAEIDPIYFAQAIHNIVQNAIESMPAGGELAVKTRKNEDHMEVSISDTGSGIDENNKELVFLPFFSTREQGMGLGLTAADRIARQHRGNLKLGESALGGSTFIFNVPVFETADANVSTGNGHANHPSD